MYCWSLRVETDENDLVHHVSWAVHHADTREVLATTVWSTAKALTVPVGEIYTAVEDEVHAHMTTIGVQAPLPFDERPNGATVLPFLPREERTEETF